MEIIAEYQFNQQFDDKSLRQCLQAEGVDARRLSRFSQLALLGALPLRQHLNGESAIYLGSPFSSPSKFCQMFDKLMFNDLPSPLDFMAHIHNAATFQLAQTLNTQGTSVFLALEKHDIPTLFELAELDLAPNQTALIGWVFERYQETQQDESLWWVVRG